MDIKEINISALEDFPLQKATYNDDDWKDLVESIKINGIITKPIVGDWNDSDNSQLVIISGHRRIKAAKEAGLTTIECDCRNYETYEKAIIEFAESNNFRTKTNEQKVAEFLHVKNALDKIQQSIGIKEDSELKKLYGERVITILMEHGDDVNIAIAKMMNISTYEAKMLSSMFSDGYIDKKRSEFEKYKLSEAKKKALREDSCDLHDDVEEKFFAGKYSLNKANNIIRAFWKEQHKKYKNNKKTANDSGSKQESEVEKEPVENVGPKLIDVNLVYKPEEFKDFAKVDEADETLSWLADKDFKFLDDSLVIKHDDKVFEIDNNKIIKIVKDILQVQNAA